MKNGRAFLRFDAGGQQIMNGTVFSDPASDLTCNASRSKKRSRDDEMAMKLQQQQQQQILNHFRFAAPPNVHDRVANPVMISSNGLPVSCEDNRTAESVETSTSGRSTVLVSPFSQDLASFLFQQNAEIDGLIRQQNEKLRLELEATRKRHCRSLLSLLEMQVLRRLKEQEAELEKANRRSAELEEKVKQMSAENQIWFNIAMNNEAIVTNLRANLEGILLQRMGHTPKEGYGDSADGVGAIADDAQSCCHAGDGIKTGNNLPEHVPRRTCKVCRENDVSVLLLPCRHLCLCKDCESKIDTCPICKSMKNASLQIFTS